MTLTVGTSHQAWARARARTAAGDVDLTWAAEDLGDGWALRADTLALVMALVAEMGPRHIVELGSGLSTRALARASSSLDHRCVVSSIDHDPAFSSRAAERVAADGLADHVRFQVAPLVARTFRGRGPVRPTYLIDEAQLASPLPPELVLIDGPPSVLGGRGGTLLQLFHLCRAGTTILLDDANRAEEQAAVDDWSARLEGMIEVTLLPEFERGLARIVVAEPPAAVDRETV